MNVEYVKYDENGKTLICPQNDLNGEITGCCVFNLHAWFDENPQKRIEKGWVKHIIHSSDQIEYDKQTHYITKSQKLVDEYTIEDVLNVLPKSEQMMLLEELGVYDVFSVTNYFGV